MCCISSHHHHVLYLLTPPPSAVSPHITTLCCISSHHHHVLYLLTSPPPCVVSPHTTTLCCISSHHHPVLYPLTPPPCAVSLLDDRYSNCLELTTLPEMVFGDNKLRLLHTAHGCGIEFNTFDALKTVKKVPPVDVKVAAADSWLKSR